MGKPPEASAYHHGGLARALMDATLAVVARDGLPALSLREVARLAGVSHGAPAHHFGDKAGLLAAVAIEGFGLFRAALVAARDAAGTDPVARYAATGRAYVMFAVEHRAHFDTMFRNDTLPTDDARIAEARGASYQVLIDAVKAAQAAGHAKDSNLEAMTVSSWAMAHGIAILWIDGNLGNPGDRERLRHILDLVFAQALPTVR